MLKQENWSVTRVLQFIDLVVITLSFFAAYYIRNFVLSRTLGEILNLEEYRWFLIIILPIWVFLLKSQEIFGSFLIDSLYNFSKKIIKVSSFGLLILGAIIFLFQEKYYSRTLILFFVFLSGLCLFLLKVTIHLIFSRMKSIGFMPRHILIVGTGKSARDLGQIIGKHKK